VEVVASLSQGRIAAAQCGLFTYKSVPVIFEPPCTCLILIYLLTAIGLTPGGSSTVHVYTETIHRTTQLIWEECGPCPFFASYTLAFALQLRKSMENLSQGSRRVPVGMMETEYTEQNIHKNKNT